MSGFLTTLRERGFIQDTTDDEALERLFAAEGDSPVAASYR